MGFRFNSFYREGTFHPFINSMNRWLKTTEHIASTPKIISKINFKRNREYQYDIALMRQTCVAIIGKRKQTPSVPQDDLLDALLYGVDPTTGDRLSEESIIDNLITFLIAGHETTSGLLSFTFYYLAKDPEVQRRAHEEVDRVFAEGEITVNDLSKLQYITALLRESLRLNPTAPSWAVSAFKDDIIGGKWPVKKDQSINVVLHCVHRDPVVYGPNADDFDPDRMLGEAFDKLPPNAWKPFGNGKRGCIGRAFAWQEALLVRPLIAVAFTELTLYL
jgi:cytochrome P450 / NADPH-cytochrome P450 reductase